MRVDSNARARRLGSQSSSITATPRSSGGGPLEGTRILVVDDNELNVRLTTKLLESSGAVGMRVWRVSFSSSSYISLLHCTLRAVGK